MVLAPRSPQRFTDPSLVTPWDFGSLIDAFRNGDYELLGCERVSERAGRLVLRPARLAAGRHRRSRA